MDEQANIEHTKDLSSSESDLAAAFGHFEESWERSFQERWFSVVDYALNSPTGLFPIYAPPEAIAVIQSDGYKKWMGNPEYPAGKALADARSSEISAIRSARFRSMESVLVEYLRFILQCQAFRTMETRPFESMDHIRSTLTLRCGDYWFEHFDLEFGDWIDEFFGDLDLASVIAEDPCREDPHPADYPSFQQAISTARYISMSEGVEVAIQRNDHDWSVSRQPVVIANHDGILCDHGDHDDFEMEESFDDSASDDYDKDSEDARQEIIDEANNFADGLALSDSDGWFYPD